MMIKKVLLLKYYIILSIFIVFINLRFIQVLYVKSLDLGGVMLWSLDQDDYTGLFCDQGPFPFTRRVYDVLQSTNNEYFNPTTTTELYTKQEINFIPTQSPSDTKIINRSEKNFCSFSVFFISNIFLFFLYN